MAVSQNALAQILSRAKSVDKRANEIDGKGTPSRTPVNESYDDEFYDPNDEFFSGEYAYGASNTPMPQMQQMTMPQMPSMNINEEAVKNSKIPNFIKESMMSNPITQNSSVLDNIPAEQMKKLTENSNRGKQRMNAPTGIDYTAIKAIMKECIEEYFEKHPLNESANLKQIQLKSGKINLIDNKGNVYGADLIYKKNLNEK